MRRAAVLPAVVALAGLVTACASLPPGEPGVVAAAVEEPFGIDGRLAAKQGAQGVSASFAWTHDPPRDELVVATPLGQTVAEIEGDASVPRVEVRLPDGRRERARDWTELMARAVGFSLPVPWLSAWVRAAPHAGSPHSAELDPSGRVSQLWQSGWEIAYTYPNAAARRPTRLRLASGDVEIAIVVDRWHP